MRLWTEYEGETIDGTFPLTKLLLPEGRSAFFSTANSKGDSAMLRLIECHFDEEEIIARWRCVEALNHPNFLRLERYGQIELDGAPAVYALFEKADANLGQVLSVGALNAKETAQIAASLIAALEMLHTHGFVHEHVAPQNVFAVGEVVKLRSDCIREAPEGQAGLDAKRRDIRDLASLVLRTLSLPEAIDLERTAALPAPFDKLVRNGANGTWGLAEMRAALEGRTRPAPTASVPSAPRVQSEPTAPTSRPSTPAPKPSSSPELRRAAKFYESKSVESKVDENKIDENKADENGAHKWRGNVTGSSIRQEDVWDEGRTGRFSLKSALTSKWAGVAGMLLILLLTGRLVEHEWHEARNPAGHARSVTSTAAPGALQHKSPAPARTRRSTRAMRSTTGKTSATAKNRSQQANGTPGARTQWRVIAYTYNQADQARNKATLLAHEHPDLRPEVFSPSGHAPYLVTVGGIMNRDEAVGLARKLRSQGLPRDTYAQNYSARPSPARNQ